MSEQQPSFAPQPWHERVSTPWQLPWPDGTLARYWTVAGATVDVSKLDHGGITYRCTGCPFGQDVSWCTEDSAHEAAQAHAETCRALPRPAQ